MPQAILIKPLARLYLYASDHDESIVIGAMVATAIGWLLMVDPPFAVASILFIATAVWHASVPQASRVSRTHLILTALALFVVTSLVFCGAAHAQSSGTTIGSMVTSLVSDGKNIMTGVSYALYAGGFASTGVGISNGIKKSRGDQQITNGHVFGYGLGGPAMGLTGYIMNSAAGSMGASASNMNTLPSATN
jgi:hypothetical protein